MLDGGAVSAPLPGHHGRAPLPERVPRHAADVEATHAAAIQAVLARREKEHGWCIVNAIDEYIIEPILNGVYFVEEAIDEAAEGAERFVDEHTREVRQQASQKAQAVRDRVVGKARGDVADPAWEGPEAATFPDRPRAAAAWHPGWRSMLVQGHAGEGSALHEAADVPLEGLAGPPAVGPTSPEAPQVEPLALKLSMSSASLPVTRRASLPGATTPLLPTARGAIGGDLLPVPPSAGVPQTLPPPRSLASEAVAAIEAAIGDSEGPAKPKPPPESLAVAAVAAAVEGRSRAAPAALPQESASPFGVGGGMRSVTREELIQSGCLRVFREGADDHQSPVQPPAAARVRERGLSEQPLSSPTTLPGSYLAPFGRVLPSGYQERLPSAPPEPERRPAEMTIGFGAAYSPWAEPDGELTPTRAAVPSSSPRLVHIVA